MVKCYKLCERMLNRAFKTITYIAENVFWYYLPRVRIFVRNMCALLKSKTLSYSFQCLILRADTLMFGLYLSQNSD